MSQPNPPIIVGAGPVGLGAALFLALQGRAPRVVEMRDEPALQSKALAINPRTLEILESTGLTQRILELGIPIRGAHFHRQGRIVAGLSFTGIHPKYPFMVALSQASTERLLAGAFAEAGGMVERGIRMMACRNRDNEVEVELEPTGGGAREIAMGPWLLAADGSRSTARGQLGIDFVGSSFADEWYLADVPLRTSLADDRAHIFFLDGGGFLFLLRVVDETLQDAARNPIWRVIGNRAEPLSRLQQAEVTGPPIWQSSFHIAHRINTTLTAGRVYFAGDAAHVHSPMGARGMNLGLEDAWVFAHLVGSGRLDQYNRLRRSVDGRVVRQVNLLSRMVVGDSWFLRWLRSVVLPVALNTRFTQQIMIRTLTGLDHKLPAQPVRNPGTCVTTPAGLSGR